MKIDPRKLERRFAELSGLAAAERADALREMQVESPELALRLARLLDAHAITQGPLEHLGDNLAHTFSTFEPESLVGRRLGDWTLVRLIGRGGMGVVFEAESQRDAITRHAAVKLLSAPLFDERAAERFVSEARVLARLDHPGICRLRDWGRSSEGWPYLVLDLIQGHTLPVGIDTRGLHQRLATMADIADTVASAHQQLVAHLDLKPANVLVDDDHRPILLDFGVAKVLNDEGYAGATMTRWLTPRYASPEQLRGEPASAAADIYALGVMLYEQLTGKPPFELEGHSVGEVLIRIEQGASPPSRRVPGLPRDLDAICARAMHPVPGQRYASAKELADDLRAVIERRPVSARPDSLGYRASRMLARHPVAVPASAFAATAVVVLAVLLAFLARDLRSQRDRAEREAARARSVTELLIGSIKAADPTGDRNGATDLNSLMDSTSRRIHMELAGEPDLLAEGLVGIGNARGAMGQHALALDAFDEAIGLMQSASYPLKEQLPARLGRLESLQASDRLAEAIEGAGKLLARVDDSDRWRVLLALGTYEIKSGDLDAAARDLGDALARVPANAHDRRAEIFSRLASMHKSRGQLSEALVQSNRAISEFEAAASGNPDTEATIRMNRAHLNVGVGKIDAALDDIDRAVAIRMQLFGEAHPLTVESLIFKSLVLTELTRYDEAIAITRHAIDVEGKLPDGGSTLLSAELWGQFGMAHLRAEHLIDAQEALRHSLEIYLRHLPADHQTVGSVRNNLASAYEQQGNHRRALEEFRKVWDVYLALSPDKPTVYQAMIASNIAECHAELGEGSAGLAWSEKALARAKHTLPPDHWVLGHIMSIHATNLLLTGRIKEAEVEALAAEKLIGASKAPAQPVTVRKNLTLLERIYTAEGDSSAAIHYRSRLSELPADESAQAKGPT